MLKTIQEVNRRPKAQQEFKLPLVIYDILIFLIVDLLLFIIYEGGGRLTWAGVLQQSTVSFLCIFSVRYIGRIYRQIWRYGGIQCYMRLLWTDWIAFLCYALLEQFLPIERIAFARLLAFCCMNLLGALAIRMAYRYCYKCGNQDSTHGKMLRFLLRVFSGGTVATEADPGNQKIKIAVIGAGSVGVGLADELRANPRAQYAVRCFIDNAPDKIGRSIHGVTVMSEDEATMESLREHHIQEVVFAVPNMNPDKKMALYERYQQAGFKTKVYDFPTMETAGRKGQLRAFDIEDLLMREEKELLNDRTRAYYKSKIIMITGGGGSIGSELCRQLAKMSPRQLIIVDNYENAAYDLQQSLLFAYKGKIDIRVEIVSITNKAGLARVFEEYHPDICINSAAHKHVPLMEKNCIEAVQNNVFGTLNVIQLCEEYGCERFMMVSTDKAVNPTNIMGATKRMCEMVMQAYSTRGKVKCSATRFGNVLGSAGSVVPLFKRQIAAGGPITLTDKRIIRYFMTIPEASQLVLASGAMANNGDLFVLDMGKPVKIYDLAMKMINLSGVEDIEIVETGLRPGEKLYEELLVKSDTLEKTDNDLIFVEHEDPVTMDELEEKLKKLQHACTSDEAVRQMMHIVVPTYKTPEEVNQAVS